MIFPLPDGFSDDTPGIKTDGFQLLLNRTPILLQRDPPGFFSIGPRVLLPVPFRDWSAEPYLPGTVRTQSGRIIRTQRKKTERDSRTILANGTLAGSSIHSVYAVPQRKRKCPLPDSLHHAPPPVASSKPVQAAETAANAAQRRKRSPNPDAKLSIRILSARSSRSSHRNDPAQNTQYQARIRSSGRRKMAATARIPSAPTLARIRSRHPRAAITASDTEEPTTGIRLPRRYLADLEATVSLAAEPMSAKSSYR